ncbi:hypothetical protein [Aureliella helgolandensis]|uniref:hypothetical protein n=1 Tax=Aureliella helgolandensis TaxID=2527968 RepID=UPI0011A60ED0|nr:hypothetical protein [Aureliella helgolandensis]
MPVPSREPILHREGIDVLLTDPTTSPITVAILFDQACIKQDALNVTGVGGVDFPLPLDVAHWYPASVVIPSSTTLVA